MRPYLIWQGDYLTKLAHTMGFDGMSMWNHPRNKPLREKRQQPDMLHPGDILWIPDHPDFKQLNVHMGASNRYVARIPKKPVELRLQVGGEPLPKEPYVILGLGPDPLEGATDENGFLKTQVQVHVREIEVILPRKNVTLRLRIGDMDPVDTISGLRKRLLHLGFYQPTQVGIENADAEDGEALIAALKAFQASKNLPATGKLDEDTRKALESAHGS